MLGTRTAAADLGPSGTPGAQAPPETGSAQWRNQLQNAFRAPDRNEGNHANSVTRTLMDQQPVMNSDQQQAQGSMGQLPPSTSLQSVMNADQQQATSQQSVMNADQQQAQGSMGQQQESRQQPPAPSKSEPKRSSWTDILPAIPFGSPSTDATAQAGGADSHGGDCEKNSLYRVSVEIKDVCPETPFDVKWHAPVDHSVVDALALYRLNEVSELLVIRTNMTCDSVWCILSWFRICATC